NDVRIKRGDGEEGKKEMSTVNHKRTNHMKEDKPTNIPESFDKERISSLIEYNYI
ncbi:5703_t:CDS:1, partial [Racocetra fulgida]